MLSIADLHCDTLFRCFEEELELSSEKLHINSGLYDRFDHFIQCFAHFLPESIEDKWEYLLRFLNNSRKVLQRAKLDVFADGSSFDSKHLAVLSVEGGDVFDSVEQIDARVAKLAEFNIKFFSMIYNHTNRLGSGAFSEQDGGLTPLGCAVIPALEKHGIVIDVSHASPRSTEEILTLATGPVCATHSNAFSITPSPRNLRDRHLKMIANSGGLVGVNFYPPFLSLQRADIFAIMRHIRYLVDLCGEDHVAFGCDFDGVDRLPEGMDNVASLEGIYSALKDAGFSVSTIEKVFYDNFKSFCLQNFRR